MFIELEKKRRSIRKFRDKAVEPDKVELLVQAALLAPSSRAIKPWEFVVVREPALIRKLSAAKSSGSAFVAGAPLVLVVCADTAKSDVWIEDASIASTLILLAAEAEDLGACWVQVRNRRHDEARSAEEIIRELLGLPDQLAVLSMIAVGYPDEQKPPHTESELLYSQVHDTTYGKPWRGR